MSIVPRYRRLDLDKWKLTGLSYFTSATSLYSLYSTLLDPQNISITGKYSLSEMKILSKLINYYLTKVKLAEQESHRR